MKRRYVEINVGRGCIRGVVNLPDEEKKYPVLIFFHGFTMDRIGLMRLHELFVRECVEQGIACVRFEFYGCGESDGNFNEMTLSTEMEDARAIWNWTLEQDFTDCEQVLLSGHSMGGLIAHVVAPELQPKGMLLWSPALTMYYQACLRGRLEGPTERGFDIAGLELSKEFIEEAKHMNFFDMSKGYEEPVCISWGTEDEVIPVDCAGRYEVLYGDKCDLTLIEGAPHQYTSLKWKRELYDVSLEFLKRQIQRK